METAHYYYQDPLQRDLELRKRELKRSIITLVILLVAFAIMTFLDIIHT